MLREEADGSGWRVWDCSRMLAAVLTSPEGRKALGFSPPQEPRSILELGAGLGELATAVVSANFPDSTVQCYCATDIGAQVAVLEEQITRQGLASKIVVRELRWGDAVVEGTYDLILASDCVYWMGTTIVEEDTLEPLLATVLSACGAHTTVLFSYRERHRAREDKFLQLCRTEGLTVEECHHLAAKFAPAEQHDPDTTGGLRLLRMHRAELTPA